MPSTREPLQAISLQPSYYVQEPDQIQHSLNYHPSMFGQRVQLPPVPQFTQRPMITWEQPNTAALPQDEKARRERALRLESWYQYGSGNNGN